MASAPGVPLQGGDPGSVGDAAVFGVITVSDRASGGVYKDLSGPAILQFFHDAIESPWAARYVVVPDEQPLIEQAIKDMADAQGCCLVVTTGGTGPAPRDVTPEATEAVCSRMLPGYGEQMRAVSLKYVPTAVLSRQTAGIRGRTLVINLPGKPKSIRETFDEVFRSIPYCIQLMGGPYVQTVAAVVPAFRPPADMRAARPAPGADGWLHTPAEAASAAPRPVIVMAHGLGGDKSALERYADAFVGAGFAVFSFDYRYWGGSQGEPRRWVVPDAQVEDWLSAVAYVQGLAGSVDPRRLSLWGTSFAGGHVITVAAKLGAGAVKSVVSQARRARCRGGARGRRCPAQRRATRAPRAAQVPHLDGRLASALSALHRGALGNAVLAVASLADAKAGAKGAENLYVPLASRRAARGAGRGPARARRALAQRAALHRPPPPRQAGPRGSLALMQLSDDELEAYGEYKGLSPSQAGNETVLGDSWRHYLTRASLAGSLSASPYSPINYVHGVKAPLLIVAGTKDGLCPFAAAKLAAAKAPNATLLALPALHFEIYLHPMFDQALAAEVAFLRSNGM
ncbi:mog [Scenedesmus sp. PABB004]|nr:mog [Scenedesmus sp. PABB004]